VLIDQFRQDRINRDDVWALIDRTLTHHERAYDNLPADEQLTTRVAEVIAQRQAHVSPP